MTYSSAALVFSAFCCCPPQLDGAAAAQASYAGWKAAAGRYQRVMQTFSSALEDAGLGRWPRKPPDLGHLGSPQQDRQTLLGGFALEVGEVPVCGDT